MSDVIRCPLCQREGPSAKAHVEPDAFYRPMRDAKRHISVVNLEYSTCEKPLQSGWWDRAISCCDCEDRLNRLDKYGVRFFRDHGFALTRYAEEFGDVLTADGVDQAELRKFLLYLAWRIAASQRHPFRCVDLGDRLENLRRLVHAESAIEPSEFPVVLKRYEGTGLVVRDGWNCPFGPLDVHLTPCVIENWGGRRVLQMGLAEYVAYMAIDDATPEGIWATLALGVTLKPVIFIKPFCQSPELKVVQRLAPLQGGRRH